MFRSFSSCFLVTSTLLPQAALSGWWCLRTLRDSVANSDYGISPFLHTHTLQCSAVQCISHFAPLNSNIRCESPSGHSDSDQYDNDTYCSTGTCTCSSTRTAWDPRPSIPDKEKQEPETTDARNRRNSPRDRFDYWILSRIKSKKICTNITKNDDR